MTHAPTHGPAPSMTPTTCFLCGRRAGAAGIGNMRKDGDMHLLCDNCQPLAAHIRATTKFDQYETQAVEDVIDAVAPMVDEFGSDLAEWSEDQRREFVVAIVLGFGTSIRKQVRDGEIPF